jgi:NADP-dependent 3-hydroxy acid dehydrogenase YdfG
VRVKVPDFGPWGWVSARSGELSGAKTLIPEEIAKSIVNALYQPEYVTVNEILIEPKEEPI